MEVYSRILLTLQTDQEAIGTGSWSDWSDGAMWIRLLEAGESRNRRTTILNMLEYMGVWDWYDRQIKIALEFEVDVRCPPTSSYVEVN
jgi:hypothetical protein